MAQYEQVEKVRLLVVDDDPPIADLVATVARYEGWEAVTANSGEEALRRAAAFHPDIVVLDLMLPDIDGFGVLDRLRQSGTMVPVVFLTARDGVADRVAGLTRGGDDYLVKPFAVEELMARLRTVLRRSTGPGFQRSVLRVADLTMDEDTREVRRVRQAADPHPHRVRGAALPHAQVADRADQGADPRPRVGVRLRRPVQRGGAGGEAGCAASWT